MPLSANGRRASWRAFGERAMRRCGNWRASWTVSRSKRSRCRVHGGGRRSTRCLRRCAPRSNARRRTSSACTMPSGRPRRRPRASRGSPSADAPIRSVGSASTRLVGEPPTRAVCSWESCRRAWPAWVRSCCALRPCARRTLRRTWYSPPPRSPAPTVCSPSAAPERSRRWRTAPRASLASTASSDPAMRTSPRRSCRWRTSWRSTLPPGPASC